MSVSIGWRPVNPKQLTYISSTSSLHSALENAFGAFPLRLDAESLDTLVGIRACGYEGADGLIDAVEEKGAIEVVAEW